MTDSTPDSNASALPLPSRVRTVDDATRRVGVELEFTGLAIERISAIVQSCLGGNIRPHSAYEHTVAATQLGDFGIELDYSFLKQRGRRDADAGLWEDIERISEDMLGAVAKRVVPFEIVGPPVAMDALHRLHPMIAALRDAGARGTNASAIYAFGLHMNPELPDLATATILAYLRAFAVAFDWLTRVSAIDISRRVFPYIQAYTRDYVRKICDVDYAPDQAQLIDDYLADNASRNRALDMLPLFAHLDQERVRAAVTDGLLRSRPTLHYRLPNCEIEQPGWDLGPAWRHWLVIESLAADPDRLADACAAYCAHVDQPFGDWRTDWATQFETYLDD